METLKRPEVLLAGFSVVAATGSAGYSYMRMNTITTELSQVSTQIRDAINRINNHDSHRGMIGELEKILDKHQELITEINEHLVKQNDREMARDQQIERINRRLSNIDAQLQPDYNLSRADYNEKERHYAHPLASEGQFIPDKSMNRNYSPSYGNGEYSQSDSLMMPIRESSYENQGTSSVPRTQTRDGARDTYPGSFPVRGTGSFSTGEMPRGTGSFSEREMNREKITNTGLRFQANTESSRGSGREIRRGALERLREARDSQFYDVEDGAGNSYSLSQPSLI